MNDWQLLDQFAAHGSDESFRMIVERHSGFVYHTALRQLGNPHIAEEATQAVFIALAQKVGKIPRNAVLSGWLFRATRFAVNNLVREEARRKRREQEAATMESQIQTGSTESLWTQISPHLNDALARLSERDREAVLIRFFEEKSHREVASALGISEDAAKMRVSRGLEKLRVLFQKRGLSTQSAFLVAALSAHGAQAAPVGLSASIATVAAGKGMATASAVVATKGILKLMAWTKTKIAIVTSCLLLPTGSFVAYKLDKWEIMTIRLWRASYDRASPKGTMFFTRRALLSGDADGYAASFQLTEQDDALRQSLNQMVHAFAKLRQQLAQTYGEVNANVAIRDIAPGVIPEAMIHSAKENASGDRILMSLGSKETKLVHMELIQSGGVWRLVPETAFGGMSRQAITGMMIQFAAAIDKTIPEIAKGTYPDAYRVQLAIKHEMN